MNLRREKRKILNSNFQRSGSTKPKLHNRPSFEALEHRHLLTGDLLITGVIDGPLAGGTPKAVELYATSEIGDLSRYAIGSANNGGGSDGPELVLSGSAAAGQFLYVASESTQFANFFGFSPDFTDSAANINGDDAVELFFDFNDDGVIDPENGDVVSDVFGDINTDGTGQPWEHLDGWAYRNSDTGPDGPVFEISNWTISGVNALDGESTNGSAAVPFPIASFTTSDAPSPSSRIRISDTSVLEGDGVATFTLTLSPAAATAVTVDVATSDGTAMSPDDYAATSSSVTFNAGETSKSISVPITDDATNEMDESFQVLLSNAVGATIADGDATGTIQDDDAPPTTPVTIWLNEFHYDNFGTDVGEFIEVAGDAGTDVAGATIVLYNGSNGAAYQTIELSGVIDNEAAGAGALAFEVSGIQNGPDAIALVNTDGSVLEFISYEGAFTATDGPASGMTSVDTNVLEPGEEGQSLQRFSNTADSVWSGPVTASPGALNTTPAPTFIIAAVDAEKAEGDSGTTAFTFEITRANNNTAANSVNYTVSSTAANAADFGGSLPSGTLSFAAGETAQTLTIDVTGELDVEADEPFTVTLSNPTGDATITTAEANGIILNDDALVPDFTIAALDAEKSEGDSGSTAFTFEVARSGDTSLTESVDFAVSSSDADGEDFGGTLPNGTISFAANEASVTLTINVAGDTTVEPDEAFTVSLSNASGNGTISDAEASATILNDDSQPAVPINIWLNEFHYDNFGTDVGEFIEVAGDAGTDVAGATIVLYNGSNGAAYQTIELSGVIDNEAAGAGALAFEVSGIQNGPDAIALVNTDGSVLEFISYEGAFTATDGPASGMTSVDTNVLEPGEEGQSLQRFSNTADSVWSGPVTASPGALNTTPAPAFSIAAVDAEKAEGDSGTTAFTFEITRANNNTAANSVNYTVSSTAANAADFGGSLPSGTLSFAAGETAQTLTIDVTGELDVEADEPFTVTLSNPTGDATITTAEANGIILNDDALVPDFTIAALDAEKSEGDSGSTAFTFEVARSGDTSLAESVDFAVSSSDADGEDFGGALPAGTINFAANEASLTLTINVAGDTTVEADEAFTVTLSNASGNGTISAAEASATILNDDSQPAVPINIWLNEFHYDNFGTDVGEFIEVAGDAGTDVAGATIVLYNGSNGAPYQTIELSGVIDNEAAGSGALAFEVSGIQNGPDAIALVNTDGSVLEFISYEGAFTATDGPASGMTSVDVNVLEPGEEGQSLQRFSNTADSVWSGPVTASPGALNTTPAPTFSIAAVDAEKAEGDSGTTAFTFEITRANNTTAANSVNYTVSSTAANAADFGGTLPSGTLSFAAGEATQTLTIDVTGELDVEADEPFTVTLSNPTGDATITTAEANGIILNDDALVPDFTIAALDAEKSEGDSGSTAFTFEVARSGDTSLTESIDFAVSSSDADGEDFGGALPAGTINFAANEASVTLTINVAGDTTVEPDEAFTVTLSNASGNGTISAAEANATILNDDSQPAVPINIWLNEFHYDNVGTDVGEFIEVAGAAGTDVAGATIVLYNGSNGAAYQTIELSGVIDNEAAGAGALAFEVSGIQNGPDAIALVNTDGSVLEFISYEGAFTATDGPASGMTSVDVNVLEPGEEGQSLQRFSNTADSVWSGPITASPGALNTDNTLLPQSSIEIDKFLWDINGLPDLHDNLAVGDEMIYSFNVTNTGETTLSNVFVSDPLPGIEIDEEVAEPYIAYSQPAAIPETAGPFASTNRRLESDPDAAQAWDNFTFAEVTVIDALTWTGGYSSSLAGAIAPETDFLIEIFTDNAGSPSNAPLHAFHTKGGLAGVDDANVATIELTAGSDITGPTYEYHAMLPFTLVEAGNYWLSITALQTFPTPEVAATWHWNQGSSTAKADGFYSSHGVPADGELATDTFTAGQNLAFTWHASRLVGFDGTLAPDRTVMFMGTYHVTQADIDRGEIENTATASGVGVDATVTASDTFTWSIAQVAEISVENLTNGMSTDDLSGVEISAGSMVTWTYEVANTGNMTFSDVVVEHDGEMTPTLDSTSDVNDDGLLSPGETWEFAATGMAAVGQHTNRGTARASTQGGMSTEAFDLTRYVGVVVDDLPECSPKLGDIDGDGSIGFQDFLRLSSQFGSVPGEDEVLESDLTCDGIVDFADFLVLSENFGQPPEDSVPTPPAVDAVFEQPEEPTTGGRRPRTPVGRRLRG